MKVSGGASRPSFGRAVLPRRRFTVNHSELANNTQDPRDFLI
jgi:hypothetical protein